ncbi:MAG: ribosome silencing factor [Elusimicrobiales bacterium]|nr:ribosome silencing factor [Elusimicrobiales bacterium]
MEKEDFKRIALIAADAASSKKAEDVKVLDLCGKSVIAEYIVMSVIESGPQLEAVMQETEDRLKKEDMAILNRDGMQSKKWRVQDYGGVIVHSFDREAAEFYDLDHVYEEAVLIDWEAELKAMKEAEKNAKKAEKEAKAKKTAAKKKDAVKTVKKTSSAVRSGKNSTAKTAKKAAAKKTVRKSTKKAE